MRARDLQIVSSNALTSIITDATTVRVTPVGGFDPRHRGRTTLLIVTADASALRHLRHCLEVDEGSLAEDLALMTPGSIDLNFTVGHRLLATVTYIEPCFVRWCGWNSDARLVDAAQLVAWLADHGWRTPSQ